MSDDWKVHEGRVRISKNVTRNARINDFRTLFVFHHLQIL